MAGTAGGIILGSLFAEFADRCSDDLEKTLPEIA